MGGKRDMATIRRLTTDRVQFACDRGLPCASWLAQIHPVLEVPTNAILLTAIAVTLLSLINLCSNIAL